ncbi:TonB-dependent receptor [Sphingomonas faeni]|uniref:TonB-dependent receptor n=1 Tax=Sphingomonas faeni TaxID=185950 RepID=UPI002413ADBD|nr:TonB-dependent receptor [Sphingomonas faeni]
MDARFFLSAATVMAVGMSLPVAAQVSPAPSTASPIVPESATATPPPVPDATAPTSPQTNAATPTGADAEGLQDIVVTAQRRSENLQRAAIAVSVVSSDALARLNVTQSSQLTTLVPALQVASSGSSNLFYLRGVGTFAVNSFSDPAIAFNYDGVYVGRPSATTGVFYDVERVEVLKGPQGTLYGRNATGGAINILPARPKTDQNAGDFSATLGSYDTVVLQGAANIVLSPDAALRISGTYSKHDGYLSDRTNDEDGKGARVQLLVRPTGNLTLRVAGDYYKAGGLGGGASLVATRNPLTGAITPTTLSRGVGLYDPRVQTVFGQQYSFQLGRTLQPLSPGPSQNSEFWGVNAEINWTTSAGTLTVIPAYRRADVNSVNAVTSFASLFDEKTSQKSVEARFASPDTGFFRYLLGGFYYHEKSDTADVFAQQTLNNFLGGKLDTTSYAAFGRVTLAFTDKLRLSGGLRYTDDRKSVDGASQTLIAVCLAASCPNGYVLPYARTAAATISSLGLFGPFPSPAPAFSSVYANPANPTSIVGSNTAVLNLEQKNSRVTWRAGVEYDVAERSLLYASVETGYRGGGFSFSVDPTRQQYRPESIQAYTIGSKNRFFDNRLQLNLEGFYWRYKNQQIAHLGVDSSGASTFFTENIGTSRNYGAEAEAQFLVTSNTLLSANVQYLNAKYTQFSYTSPSPPPTRCAVNTPTGSSIATIDCSGLKALRAPEWTMNLGARQTIPIGSGKIILQGDARYQSTSYVGFELLDIQRQTGYWTGQASATVSPDGDAWSVTAFVNNIGNQRPWGDIIYNGNANVFAGSPGAPRLYGVRFAVHY